MAVVKTQLHNNVNTIFIVSHLNADVSKHSWKNHDSGYTPCVFKIMILELGQSRCGVERELRTLHFRFTALTFFSIFAFSAVVVNETNHVHASLITLAVGVMLPR